jgi:hypothetical protein
MTDLQLYILATIPLVGILANTGLFIHLSSTMNARFGQMDARFERIDARFDMLMSKVVELVNRVVRVEERLGIKP